MTRSDATTFAGRRGIPGSRGTAIGLCRLALTLACVALGAADSQAQHWNGASIAVPALGNQGIASVYPSTIDVVVPQGPLDVVGVNDVILDNVTHPCPATSRCCWYTTMAGRSC
jgi:hypothetical protein